MPFADGQRQLVYGHGISREAGEEPSGNNRDGKSFVPTGKSSTGHRRPTRSLSRTLTKCSMFRMAKFAVGYSTASPNCSFVADSAATVDGSRLRPPCVRSDWSSSAAIARMFHGGST